MNKGDKNADIGMVHYLVLNSVDPLPSQYVKVSLYVLSDALKVILYLVTAVLP